MYANVQRSPPTILTYCYNSELVYVAPAESYDVRFCLFVEQSASYLSLGV